MAVELSIKGQDEPAVKVRVPRLKLYLEQDGSRVNLKGRDEDGDEWFIAGIDDKGRFVRFCSLPDTIGLEVDSEGRIKLNVED